MALQVLHCAEPEGAVLYSDDTLFLADRTNGRAYATVLRPSSSSVCRLSRYVLWLNGAS